MARILVVFLLGVAALAQDHRNTRGLRDPLVVENVGQFPDEVRFQIISGADTISVTGDSLWMARRGAPAYRINFAGANDFDVQMGTRSATRVSYFLGSDPAAWQPDVPVYTGARLKNLFDGVDLEFATGDSGLEWRWVVARGAKVPAREALRVEGAKAEDFHYPGAVDENGNRIIGKSGASAAGAANLVWTTYVNFVKTEEGAQNIAIDAATGQVVLAGTVSSIAGFPATAGTVQPAPRGGDDAVLLKLNPANGGLVFATFFGGTGNDGARGVAIDPAGNIYVAGSTDSVDFPTSADAARRVGLRREAFLFGLNSTGTALLASTLIGGDQDDEGTRVAIGPGNTVALAGTSKSPTILGAGGGLDLPLTSDRGFVADMSRDRLSLARVFVFAIVSTLASLTYDTTGAFVYAGGTLRGPQFGLALDGVGYPKGGVISSVNPNGFVTSGQTGGYVLRIDRQRSGKDLVCVVVPTQNSEVWLRSIAVDRFGNMFIAGATNDPYFPTTAGAVRSAGPNQGMDGFLMKVKPDCSSALFSTMLGGLGANDDSANAIALDSGNNVYVVGTTAAGFPTTPDAFQPNAQGVKDAFVALIKDGGRQVAYGSFFGGLDNDEGQAVAVLPDQTVVIAGTTRSPGLPGTTAAFEKTLEGPEDLFVSKFTIANPGIVSGYAFQDYNQDNIPGLYEQALSGMTIWDDTNPNGVKDPGESATLSIYAVAYYQNTNIPYVPFPNYALGNLPIGTHRICASFAPTLAGQSTCKTAIVTFGGTTPNINFGFLPGQVGVSELTPKNSTAKAGEPTVLTLHWTHPHRWRALKDWIIRLVAEDGTEALQLRYVEAANQFSVFNPNSGKFGPAFPPGGNAELETDLAKFYVADSTVTGSGPTGPDATWSLKIGFKPRAAGRTYQVLFEVSDDNGLIQGDEPLGSMTVLK